MPRDTLPVAAMMRCASALRAGWIALGVVSLLSCAPAEPTGSYVETLEPLVLTPAGFVPEDTPGFLHQRVEADRVVFRFDHASPIQAGMVIASLSPGAVYVRHVTSVEDPGDGTTVAYTEAADVTQAFRSGHVVLHLRPEQDMEEGVSRAALVDLFASVGPLECQGGDSVMLRRYFEPRIEADADIRITAASVASGAVACAVSQFVPLSALGANCMGVIDRFSLHIDARISSGVAISHNGDGECALDAVATQLPEWQIPASAGVPMVIGIQPTISFGFTIAFEEQLNARVGATLAVRGDIIYDRRTGWRRTFGTPSLTSDISGLELSDTLEVGARWQAGVRIGAYVGGIAGPYVDVTGQLDGTHTVYNGWGACGSRFTGSATVEFGGELRCPPVVGTQLCPASARIGVALDPVPLWSGPLYERPMTCVDNAPTACACDDLDGDGHYDARCGDTRCLLRADCDDHDASIHPGVADVCDFVDNDCDGDTDPGCGALVRRYHDCTSHHWSSTLESTGPYCAPAPSAPAAGCALAGCALTTCSATSCWTAEYGVGKSFHTYARQEGRLTSLRQLHHCYRPDTLENTYQLSACAGGLVAGIPSELGLIAQTPTGFMTAQLYSCRWMPGLGGVDHFLTTNLSECTGVSGVAAPLGYVMP